MIYKLNSNKKHKHDYERIVEYYYKKIFQITKYIKYKIILKLVKYICKKKIKNKKISKKNLYYCQFAIIINFLKLT